MLCSSIRKRPVQFNFIDPFGCDLVMIKSREWSIVVFITVAVIVQR